LADYSRLETVVDVDGRTITVGYDNVTYSNLITSVTDPYGRTAHFHYDDQAA